MGVDPGDEHARTNEPFFGGDLVGDAGVFGEIVTDSQLFDDTPHLLEPGRHAFAVGRDVMVKGRNDF